MRGAKYAVLGILTIPLVANAAWWNPFDWFKPEEKPLEIHTISDSFLESTIQLEQSIGMLEAIPKQEKKPEVVMAYVQNTVPVVVTNPIVIEVRHEEKEQEKEEVTVDTSEIDKRLNEVVSEYRSVFVQSKKGLSTVTYKAAGGYEVRTTAESAMKRLSKEYNNLMDKKDELTGCTNCSTYREIALKDA